MEFYFRVLQSTVGCIEIHISFHFTHVHDFVYQVKSPQNIFSSVIIIWKKGDEYFIFKSIYE